MKMFNSSKILVFVAIALVLAFAVPLKAQDLPQDYLDAHNRARTAVNVGPLVLNDTLASYARSYAIQRSDCRLTPSGGPYGENLAYSRTGFTAAQAVDFWVSQSSNYSYDTNTCRAGANCDAYRNVVWKKTVSLGCAKINCGDGGSLAICEYDPSSVPGERPF